MAYVMVRLTCSTQACVQGPSGLGSRWLLAFSPGSHTVQDSFAAQLRVPLMGAKPKPGVQSGNGGVGIKRGGAG